MGGITENLCRNGGNTLKTKQEILTALAHSGDDKLLLAGLLDKEQA